MPGMCKLLICSVRMFLDYAPLGGALGGVKLCTNRRQGLTEQARVLLAWSYSAVVYLAIVVLTSLILHRPQPNRCFSKAA